MIASITLAGFPAGNGVHSFDWRGNNILRGASGTGKSTIINAILALYGAADLPSGKLTIEAMTGGNTALSIAQTAGGSRTYERQKGDNAYKGAAQRDFAGWSVAAQDADLVRAIALPMEWHRLATSDLGRPLRDLFTRILPPADVPARIRTILTAGGHTIDEALLTVATIPKDSDYATEIIRALLDAQRAANTAKDKADGEATARAKVLAETKANPVDPVDEDAVAAARAAVETERAWVEYDRLLSDYERDLARHTDAESKRAAWQEARDALPTTCPEVDPDALATAQRAVEDARVALRVAEEADRIAAEAEARAQEEARRAQEDAQREADRQARAEAESQRVAEAPSPTPTPTVTAAPIRRANPSPAPSLFTAPTAQPKRCPTCNQPISEATDALDF